MLFRNKRTFVKSNLEKSHKNTAIILLSSKVRFIPIHPVLQVLQFQERMTFVLGYPVSAETRDSLKILLVLLY